MLDECFTISSRVLFEGKTLLIKHYFIFMEQKLSNNSLFSWRNPALSNKGFDFDFCCYLFFSKRCVDVATLWGKFYSPNRFFCVNFKNQNIFWNNHSMRLPIWLAKCNTIGFEFLCQFKQSVEVFINWNTMK